MERKLVVTIFAMAALALLTQIVVWVYVARDQSQDFVGPPRSDYTLTNFSVDSLDEFGQHSFSIVAPRMVRKEDDGSMFVTSPNYEILDGNGNVWKGTSDSAWVNKDGSIMRLEGNVDMNRIPTPKTTPVKLQTSDLTITTPPKVKGSTAPRSQEKKLETAALTTITDPGHVVHGIGMKSDLAMKETELLSDVHWISLPSGHANEK
ncbi:MAG: LPS export ABC transporter periplasmic protein LptC [Rudaea sp.]